jgi:Outer membrane protein beta-barrel domain
MKGTILLVLSVIAGALPAQAGDKGEFQLSVQIGRQNILIDAENLIAGDQFNHDGLEVGFALGWRLQSGLLFEASLLHSGYTDFGGVILSPLGVDDESLDNYQYSGAVGWQFDKNRWRFTPKAGMARSKLTSRGEVLLDDDGARTDTLYATVPFLEATAARRMGEHFALGLSWRETFQDFGHSRSVDVTLHWFLD